jgi:hypothetical protein
MGAWFRIVCVLERECVCVCVCVHVFCRKCEEELTLAMFDQKNSGSRVSFACLPRHKGGQITGPCLTWKPLRSVSREIFLHE